MCSSCSKCHHLCNNIKTLKNIKIFANFCCFGQQQTRSTCGTTNKSLLLETLTHCTDAFFYVEFVSQEQLCSVPDAFMFHGSTTSRAGPRVLLRQDTSQGHSLPYVHLTQAAFTPPTAGKNWLITSSASPPPPPAWWWPAPSWWWPIRHSKGSGHHVWPQVNWRSEVNPTTWTTPVCWDRHSWPCPTYLNLWSSSWPPMIWSSPITSLDAVWVRMKETFKHHSRETHVLPSRIVWHLKRSPTLLEIMKNEFHWTADLAEVFSATTVTDAVNDMREKYWRNYTMFLLTRVASLESKFLNIIWNHENEFR